ncbi:MAG: acyl-CoA synthetase FdrA [Candidatus Xenobium sp.]|jgi:FdrA protein|nr:acyl-CoA synthetase FdrA [Burkholderiales bacterium]
MKVQTLIKTSEYHDSVKLMLVAREVSRLAGVRDAAVVMGTEANKSLLEQSGLLSPQAQAATPNDLVMVVSAQDPEVAQAALKAAEVLLAKRAETTGGGLDFRPRTLRSAVKAQPGSNVAVISVTGRFAADEARQALTEGLHVLLFSDNVSLEDEISLKKMAHEKGLLMMGPGAGTAILNGVALGFANRLPRGPVGVVSAAGTGLQEVTTLLARQGVGISQGIGTGGRDLREDVGGIMMLDGLLALQEDPETRVIILVSKPPAPSVTTRVLEQVSTSRKPTVVCFMGGEVPTAPGLLPARTLQEAALLAAALLTEEDGKVPAVLERQRQELQDRARPLAEAMPEGRTRLRGLFSGGTLAYEAQVIWRDLLSEPVFSNAPLDPIHQMSDSTRSQGHTIVDLGEEEFTVGRPHPMIDQDLRTRRILQEAQDSKVAVLVLDLVLGYGAHPDPAGELSEAIRKAREAGIVVVASVTGTEQDPQALAWQTRTLRDAGVELCESNAAAAQLAGMIVARLEQPDVARGR